MLNYLGYSWVDQGLHLDEAFKMLRRAVELQPEDGYIADSLAWAHYKLGHYDEAVKLLERAIELKPGDPVINDHLGDAYWQVGRKLDAQFQWNHARDLNPDPEELPKILAKIEKGLPETASAPKKPRHMSKAGGADLRLGHSSPDLNQGRHCERSEAIRPASHGLLRFARNDGARSIQAC